MTLEKILVGEKSVCTRNGFLLTGIFFGKTNTILSSAKRALIYNDPVAIFLTGHPQYIFWTNVLSVEKQRACTCFLSNLIILLFNVLYFFQLNVKGLDLNINHWNLTLGRTRIRPPWYKGEGGMDPPWVFDMLQYFETILLSVESLWSSLQVEVYFMGGGAAGGLWRHQTWSPSWPPSWILSRIKIIS